MKTFFVLFVIGLVSSHAFGFRLKRQTDEQESDLDDRYGWNQQTLLQTPWMLINQGQFPGQRPGQLPGRFPGQLPGQFPGQLPGQFPGGQRELTTSTTPTPSTTSSSGVDEVTTSTAMRDCIARCPVTSEYNPVCGSNRETYPNPGRLECARACGVSVTLLRTSPCPPATVAPSQ